MKIIQIVCLLVLIFAGLEVSGAQRYSNGIVLGWDKDQNGNYSYFWDSKPLGTNDQGMKAVAEQLEKRPDYSVVIVNNLSKYPYEAQRFYRDKAYDQTIKKMKDHKHLLFAYLNKSQFDFPIKKVEFIYVQYHKPHYLTAYFLNSQEIGVHKSEIDELKEKLQNPCFFFIVFEEQTDMNDSTKMERPTTIYKKLIEFIESYKCNYCIATSSCVYPGASVDFYDYNKEMKRRAEDRKRAEWSARLDAEISALPKEFDDIEISGTFNSLSEILAQMNKALKEKTSYGIINSCPEIQVRSTAPGNVLSFLLRIFCSRYKLRITVKGKKIIIHKDDTYSAE